MNLMPFVKLEGLKGMEKVASFSKTGMDEEESDHLGSK